MDNITPQLGYAPIIVVKNIVETFLPYRGIKYDQHPSDDQIINDLYILGYFKILTDKITIVVIDERDDNPCYVKKENFKQKVLGPISTEQAIIIVGNGMIDNKKYLMTEVVDTRKEKKININIYEYEKFVYPIPYCDMVQPHFIMTDEEVAEMFEIEGFAPADMKIISVNDTPVVWLGAVVGQYIRVENVSQTAGKSIEYYVVKP